MARPHERVTINILIQKAQILQVYKGMIWKTAQQKLNRHFGTWVKAMKGVTDCASIFTFLCQFVFALGFESSQAVPGDPFTNRSRERCCNTVRGRYDLTNRLHSMHSTNLLLYHSQISDEQLMTFHMLHACCAVYRYKDILCNSSSVYTAALN